MDGTLCRWRGDVPPDPIENVRAVDNELASSPGCCDSAGNEKNDRFDERQPANDADPYDDNLHNLVRDDESACSDDNAHRAQAGVAPLTASADGPSSPFGTNFSSGRGSTPE